MGGDRRDGPGKRRKSRFNPRPRMGGDFIKLQLVGCGSWFQSTPPHGGRPISGVTLFLLIRFNPRPRMGGDNTPQAK